MVALDDPSAVQAAFDQVIATAPDDIKYRQQYTLALSATQAYDAAMVQAQAGLQLAQEQQRESDIAALNQLIQDLQARKAVSGS